MRLFTAIELPDDVRSHLVGLAEQLDFARAARLGYTSDEPQGFKYVRPENLHVTLKFLGDVDDARVDELRGTLESVEVEPVGAVFVDRAELLPPRGPVRVIAMGLGGDDGGVVRLFRAVEDRCVAFGADPERRAYRPHVTLARARAPLPAFARETLAETLGRTLPGPHFHVRHFTLFKSELKRAGPDYAALARFPIGAR